MLSKTFKVLLTLPLMALLSVTVACVVLLASVARMGGSGAANFDFDRFLPRG